MGLFWFYLCAHKKRFGRAEHPSVITYIATIIHFDDNCSVLSDSRTLFKVYAKLAMKKYECSFNILIQLNNKDNLLVVDMAYKYFCFFIVLSEYYET